MSSQGGQWRVIRHFLSVNNLNAEIEKLVHKLKPSTPEQWESFLKKIERAVTVRLSQTLKGEELTKTKEQSIINASTLEQTENTKEITKDEVSKDTVVKREIENLVVDTEAKELTLQNLWQALKLKKDLYFGNISEPAWKTTKPAVTKMAVHSRTSYVTEAVARAQDAASVTRRADALVQHLHHYPEAKDLAIKEGALRALLRAERRLGHEPSDELARGHIREALALIGHVGPPRGPAPRVLSLDGGGVRGVATVEILRELERLSGRRVTDLFDFIVGVSTGAIIAAILGSGVGTLETATQMYYTLSKEMFGNTSVIGGTSRLVWSQGYYDTAAWERLLQQHLRDTTLTQCNRTGGPQLALVSCLVDGARPSPFVFRSYRHSRRVVSSLAGTSRAQLWQAVRASAAAPSYFTEYELRGARLQDGGVIVNNPAGVATHEARLLYRAAPLLVSVGTGRLVGTVPRPAPPTSPTGWADKFNKILESATDTEGVHLVLSAALPPDEYYRLNPVLSAACSMHETDSRRLDAVGAAARAYCRRNRPALAALAAGLARPRPALARLRDALSRRLDEL